MKIRSKIISNNNSVSQSRRFFFFWEDFCCLALPCLIFRESVGDVRRKILEIKLDYVLIKGTFKADI